MVELTNIIVGYSDPEYVGATVEYGGGGPTMGRLPTLRMLGTVASTGSG